MKLLCRSLLLASSLLTVAAVSADDLTTSGGKKLNGKLIAVDAQGVTFSNGGAQAKIAGKDIVVVDFHHEIMPIPKDKESGVEAKVTRVELLDGSVLRCTKAVLKGKVTEVELFAGPAGVPQPVFELPISGLFTLMRDASSPKTQESWKKLLAARGKRDLYVIREGDSLNFVQGTILSGNDNGDEIIFEKDDGAKTVIRQSRAAGYVFAQALPNETPQTLCRVIDVFGNSLVAQTIEVTASGITVKTVAGMVVKYSSPLALSKFDYSQGNIAYLSDLDPRVDTPEAGADEKGLRLNPSAPYLRDRSLTGELLKLGSEHFPKGLLIAPDTVLTYTLNGDYREFKAVIGMPEYNPDANLESKVTIEADGRALLSEAVKRKDKPKGVSLDVKGVKTLRIVVEADFAVNGGRVLFGGALVQK